MCTYFWPYSIFGTHTVYFELCIHSVLYAGAWIITGGTHAGVMKHVGQALRDYTLSSNPMQGQIVAIGVATWGIIHNRDVMVHSEVPYNKFTHFAFLHSCGHIQSLFLNLFLSSSF